MTLVVVLVLFTADSGYSQYPDPAELDSIMDVRPNSRTMFVRPGIALTSDFFVTQFHEELGLTQHDQLVLDTVKTDQTGLLHYKYRQIHKGIPVRGAILLTRERNMMLESATYYLYPDIDVNVNPILSEQDAIAEALEYIDADEYMWEDSLNEAWIREEYGDSNATFYPQVRQRVVKPWGPFNADSCALAYVMPVFSIYPGDDYRVFVDAITGDIIKLETLVHTHDALGASQFDGDVPITVRPAGDNFELFDDHRGSGVVTMDALLNLAFGAAVPLTDSDGSNDGYWTSDPEAYNVHWGLEQMYDYMLDEFGWNSYNDRGKRVRGLINYPFPGSGNSNATHISILDIVAFGNGGTSCPPFVSVDVVGHEFAHGLTDHSAGLRYANESGALNESFSDIFGFLLEREVDPANVDWLIGEDIGCGFRSLLNPNSTNQPAYYEGSFWQPPAGIPSRGNDWGGVHTNSGVQNYWFYLLSQHTSGVGVNEVGDKYEFTAIAIDDAAQIVFENLTNYLTPRSDHRDAFDGSVIAAKTLYGDCSAEHEAVVWAWHAVGVAPTTVITGPSIEESDICRDGRIRIIDYTLPSDADFDITSMIEVKLVPEFHAEEGCEVTISATCCP